LCCVAPAFDRSDDFAIDKPADTPCPNLGGDFSCTIHSQLAGRGFRGCVVFDCLGAGQRVVQEVFGGVTWRERPDLARQMFACFSVMRDIQRLLQLLDSAAKLDLSADQYVQLDGLKARLGDGMVWTADELGALALAEISRDVHEFLTSLKPLVDQTRP